MTGLDSALDDANRWLMKKIEEEKKEALKPMTFNGKKIIPFNEWWREKMEKSEDWADYYPDEYKIYLIKWGIECRQTKEFVSEWLKGFTEYMRSEEIPSYGRACCENCLLWPDELERSYYYDPMPRSTTIRDVLLKTSSTMDDKPFEHPCKVVNVFKCPYKVQETRHLRIIGSMWQSLDRALRYNKTLTEYKHNMYRMDFERNVVGPYFGISGISAMKIEEFPNIIKFPKYEINDHKDLYDVFTNRDKLRAVWEEYLDARLSKTEEKITYEEGSLGYFKKYMDHFLNFFEEKEAREIITLENIRNTDGKTLSDVEKERIEHEKWLSKIKSSDSDAGFVRLGPEDLSGVCFSCNEFANIRCFQCKTWMCLQHWRDHGIQAHNYTKPEE